MVNTGHCSVQCQCGRGVFVKTSVNRNKKMEMNVMSNRCDHFENTVSIYTNSNYVAWFVIFEIFPGYIMNCFRKITLFCLIF